MTNLNQSTLPHRTACQRGLPNGALRQGTLRKTSLIAAALLLAPLAVLGQTSSGQTNSSQGKSSQSDRWLHVRVISQSAKGETVRVNVPLELAEKVLPTIDHDRLHDGKVHIDSAECHGVDLRALLDAVRTSKDGEFVTVQKKDAEIRVAKQNGYFLVHILDKGKPKESQVEVKVPMKVVEAMFSAGKDELDLVAGLHALSAQGDTELVSVKDDDSTIRVWLDSKNVAD
jgi:hypothetical protein